MSTLDSRSRTKITSSEQRYIPKLSGEIICATARGDGGGEIWHSDRFGSGEEEKDGLRTQLVAIIVMTGRLSKYELK